MSQEIKNENNQVMESEMEMYIPGQGMVKVPVSATSNSTGEDEKSKEPEKQEEPQKEEEPSQEDSDIVIDTPLMEFKTKKSQNTSEKIEKFEDLPKYIENAFGEKVENPEYFVNVVRRKKELEGEVVKYKGIEAKFDNQVKFIDTLPFDIKNILIEYAKNPQTDGYKKLMEKYSSSSVDFSKPTEKLSTDEIGSIIVHYNPDIENDTLEEMDEKALNIIKNSTLKLYEKDHKEFISGAEKFSKQQKEQGKKITDSIERSIENLKKQYPTIKQDKLEKVRESMLSGYTQQLFDNDGTYKEEAASKIAMAEFGKETIDTMQQQWQKLSTTEKKKAEVEGAERVIKETFNDEPSKKPASKPKKNSDQSAFEMMPWLKTH